MSVRVRMAPSPTGFLHIGGVRTFLFNWLFARSYSGECLLRIENTDTGREVAESVEQIERSLRWLGIEWDGETRFQLDGAERCRTEAARLVAEGRAYEDDGAIRIRMPEEGVVGWDDAVKGRIEFPADQLEDMVILRSDGRPVYNFASPVDDWVDGITHVIRGDDHVSNTPKQIVVLRALGADLPVYAHAPNVFGEDGKKLSKRHGAVSVGEFREAGYIAPALMNFLALLGWAPDGETTIMSRDELAERFTLEKVGSSPATFDYAKLDWMNGLYLRALDAGAYADTLVTFLREQGSTWNEARVREAAPAVQEKIGRLGEFAGFAGFLFEDVDPDLTLLDGGVLTEAASQLATVEPWDAATIERALKALCERLEAKPKTVYLPIRVAVTGSRISPGLYESLELLGRDVTLARLRQGADGAA
ncbi:MAG: glutamate--tRNA ligase [Thermoleophilia bacterium]|nr:glutamate--tRNA ligase [Thermoleophilia bacterium]